MNSQVDLQQSQCDPSSVKMIDQNKESDILHEIDKEMNVEKSASSKTNSTDDRSNKVPSKKIDDSVQDIMNLQTAPKLEENTIFNEYKNAEENVKSADRRVKTWENLSTEKKYEDIRNSTADVETIAKNTGYKNIQKCKNHLFYETPILDRYKSLGEPVEIKRFDANEEQARAWKRLEERTHTQDDLTWLKHEKAEQWYEQKHNAGYSESHEKAENHWLGTPWTNTENKNNLEDKK